MYRFLLRPKWIGFHLLVAGAMVAMVNLGLWQLRRLDQRRDFNAVVEARYDATPVPIGDLLTAGTDPDDVEWRPVTTAGEYLPGDGVRIVNRSQSGRAGDNLVVPLRLDDGRLLLVNRGFVPIEADAPAPPGGHVAVTGRLHPSETRRLGQLSDPEQGRLTEAQRIDIERLAPQLPGEPVPMYLDLIESQPPDATPFPEPIARPELGEGPHLSYAVQWFLFTVAVGVGWVLAVRHSLRARQVAARRSASSTTDRNGSPGTLENSEASQTARRS